MKSAKIIIPLLIALTGIAANANALTPKCPEGLTFKDGLCYCGDIGLPAEEANTWECIDNSHYLCLRKLGCTQSGHVIPTWGFLGDHSNSFDENIPKMPANPDGYELEYTPQGLAWDRSIP